MIHTLTPHPAIDRTVRLAAPLEPGATQRALGVADTAGGKGVNVARALTAAGVAARALVAVDAGDPLAALLDAAGLPWAALPAGGPTRVNLALLAPDGTTTKIDAAGPTWPGRTPDDVLAPLSEAPGWLVCCGSLPPGAPPGTYAELGAAAAERGLRVAVDTSGPALLAAAACPAVGVLAPNEAELAQALAALGGAPPAEGSAADGPPPAGDPEDLPDVVASARALLATAPPDADPASGRGADSNADPAAPAERLVLVTCGSRGAALVTARDAWWADAPAVDVVSTVGAGDAALAGLVSALDEGAAPPAALARAVAWGSAAVTAAPGAPLRLPGRTADGPGRAADGPGRTVPGAGGHAGAGEPGVRRVTDAG